MLVALAGGVIAEPDMYAAQGLYQRRGYLRQPDRDWSIGQVVLLAYWLSLNPG